ncbi:MAG: metallophosphoesterase [Acidobacteriota bacterium]
MTRRMRFVVFFSTVLGIWLLLHLYLGWRLWSLPLFTSRTGHRVLLFGLAVGFAAYPIGRILYHHGWPRLGTVLEYAGGVWMGCVILLMFTVGIVDLVTVFGLVLRSWVIPLRSAAVVVAVVLASIAWVGGHLRPRTVDIEAAIPNLPAEADGLVIAHLSDLHLGSLIGKRSLCSVIDQIEVLKPDLVAVTGDLVDGDAEFVESLVPELRNLTAPLGVYSILGNHEIYAGADRCRTLMRDAGFIVLDGTAVEVMPGVWVAGVPDSGHGPGTDGLDGALEGALAGIEEGAAVIYLQHAPGNEEMVAAGGVGLMLDGHTHGGQIWPFHYLVRRAYPFFAGVRTVGSMTQVVSRGAGRWGPPMRLFARSEIYRITLRRPR